MIERRRNERRRTNTQANRGAAALPRLVLAWYVDPTTRKPAARWVCEAPSVNSGEEVATAA